MTWREFLKSIENIEVDLKGAGYFVRLRLTDGSTAFGALLPFDRKSVAASDLIGLERAGDDDEREDYPNIYMPVSSIVAVEGPMMRWNPEKWRGR